MRSRHLSAVVVALFVAFLVAPGASAFLAPSTAEVENRQLAPFPDLSVDSIRNLSYFGDLRDYVSDHMSVRTLGIRLSANIHYHLLGQSSNPNAVVVGDEGWLYLRETFDDGCDLAPDEVQVPDLVDLVDSLETRGMTVVYAAAPDKMSIYPEYLTPEGEALATCSIEAGRHLETALEETARSGYLDLWKLFRRAATDDQVYFRTDSHFNYLGNRLFFDRLVDTVDPDMQLSWATERGFHRGNLFRTMGLGGTESVDAWTFEAPSPAQLVEQADTPFGDDYYATEAYTTDDPVIGGSMLVLKDSFMDLGMHQFATLWDRTTFTDFRSPASVERFFEEIPENDFVLIISAEHSMAARFGGDHDTISPLVNQFLCDSSGTEVSHPGSCG